MKGFEGYGAWGALFWNVLAFAALGAGLWLLSRLERRRRAKSPPAKAPGKR